MLPEKQLKQIREELDNCNNPLFFFHDDSDGLCSFLLLYRYKHEGKGVVVKSQPLVDEKFIRKVEECQPDKIFILDIAIVTQEFIDAVKVPIIWIDHHLGSEKRYNIKQFNPRTIDEKDGSPVSTICYNIVKQDLWLGACGTIGDWKLTEETKKFSEERPDLLPKNIKDPGKAHFETEIGKLSRLFNFILKGKTQDAMKCVKVLTRIDEPNEILQQTTPQGKFVYKRYDFIYKKYEELLGEAKRSVKKDKLLVFSYEESKMSFSGELSNELMYLYPNKVIAICREKSGEMKCSLRSIKIPILKSVQKAVEEVNGHGGGHEHACGAGVKKEHFEEFLNSLKRQLNI